MHFLLEPFAYDFMLRAFAAGILTAIIAPMIGIFLVTRRYSFMADTLAHVSLAGIAVGTLTGIHPIFAALGASAIAALAVEQLRSAKRVLGESALALFLSGGLALASVLLSLAKGNNVNLGSLLFGSITTVSVTDVTYVFALGVVVLVVILILYRQLFSISFDEELSLASGLNVGTINRILVLLAAVTVSLTMRIVGVLLVGALMIIPVVAAMQWKLSFLRTLLLAIAISLFSVVTGLLLSFYAGTASGGTIVLVAIACFLVGLGFNRR